MLVYTKINVIEGGGLRRGHAGRGGHGRGRARERSRAQRGENAMRETAAETEETGRRRARGTVQCGSFSGSPHSAGNHGLPSVEDLPGHDKC